MEKGRVKGGKVERIKGGKKVKVKGGDRGQRLRVG